MSTLTPAQALRIAEDEQRVHVGTMLAMLLVVDCTNQPTYREFVGAIHGHQEAAHALDRLACQLEQMEGGPHG